MWEKKVTSDEWRVGFTRHSSLTQLLQPRHQAGVFFGEHARLLLAAAFGDDMKERAIGIGQDQHPLIAQIDLDAIDLLELAIDILLVENAHDFALVLPAAG